MERLASTARKIVIFTVGFIVIIVGILLLVLPGPGVLVIIAGLAILAIEFEWAKRHHQRLKTQFQRVIKRLNQPKR
ncbi:MAG TPA: PGPGW domain-containing protein [Candidatus Saccharimonadales bacterium]|nr:PGPGW domain-containing protein [Candidatus Saccharimonadales bacterium]